MSLCLIRVTLVLIINVSLHKKELLVGEKALPTAKENLKNEDEKEQ